MKLRQVINTRNVKRISLSLIVILLWHVVGFAIYAQGLPLEREQAAARRAAIISAGGSKGFDSLLGELKEAIKQGSVETKTAPQQGFANLEKIESLKTRLANENEKNETYFSAIEDLIKEKNLGDEILNRQKQFAAEYRVKYTTLLADVAAIESASNKATGLLGKITRTNQNVDYDGPVNRAIAFLEESTPPPSKHHFDPNNLPHRSLKADHPIQPKLTRVEWDRALSGDFAEQVSTGSGSDRVNNSAIADKSVSTASGGDRVIRSNHARRSSALVPPLVPGTSAPTAADLAETIEVKFTPEIKALADSLDKNPVKIYNWVHNNIEFVPTWGSIQGAELCMENRAGNAFDTSSLLIALLRYSGVPARYQMGTIEVPIEKFKNWAGGFTNTEAAASFFASGGVPSVVRRKDQSGQVVSVRLEHVWVKPFIDYAPSGGVVNGGINTWIDLDPSFKQFSITQGVDFESVIPSNAGALGEQLLSGGKYDGGLLIGIDSTLVTQFQQQNTERRLSYLQTNRPHITLGDAFGGQKIATASLSIMPAAAPYKIIARASELAELPASIRHRISVGLRRRSSSSNDLFSCTFSLPELGTKDVLILYVPASSADEQLLGGGLTTIPGYVKFIPSLYINGQQVAHGDALAAGAGLVSQIDFSSPTITTPPVVNDTVVGETAALGFDLQGVPKSAIEALRQKTQALRDTLISGNVQGIQRGSFAEAQLSSVIVGWFATVDSNNRRSSLSVGAVTVRYPSAGISSVKVGVNSVFGAPTSLTPDSLSMDIDRDMVVSAMRDGDIRKRAALALSQGLMGSALEAEIPRGLLSTHQQPISAIATAQALKMANDQGIPVYTIDSTNAAVFLPKLAITGQDLNDIQDAVNAGLTVTVSQRPVRFEGKNVLGSIVQDPATGSASFLVTGGTNGAIIVIALAILLILVAEATFTTVLILPELLVFGFILIALVGIASYEFSEDPDLNPAVLDLDPQTRAIVVGLTVIFSMVVLIAAALTTVPLIVSLFAGIVGLTLVAEIINDLLQGSSGSNAPAGRARGYTA